MTRDDILRCKRIFDEKDAAENQVMWMENLIKWFSENQEEYGLRLVLFPNTNDLKRCEVDITHCFRWDHLQFYLKEMQRRAEQYKIICDGLKWQPPQMQEDIH